MRRVAAISVWLLLLLGGCRSPGPFPVVDRTAPGWSTRTGQAIWKPDARKPEIIGDLVIATQADGSSYLQFSKALPIASAWLSPADWQVEFPPQGRRYSGRGKPPERIVWLQLLSVMRDGTAVGDWQVRARSDFSMTLENSRTGERVETHF